MITWAATPSLTQLLIEISNVCSRCQWSKGWKVVIKVDIWVVIYSNKHILGVEPILLWTKIELRYRQLYHWDPYTRRLRSTSSGWPIRPIHVLVRAISTLVRRDSWLQQPSNWQHIPKVNECILTWTCVSHSNQYDILILRFSLSSGSHTPPSSTEKSSQRKLNCQRRARPRTL